MIRALALGLLIALIVAVPVSADRRVALVMANAQYQAVPALRNPPGDATLVAAALRRAGFAVEIMTNLDKPGMERALSGFGEKADNADVALVYYAGHGIEAQGRNFLIPIDAHLLRDRDADLEAVSLDSVLSVEEGAKLRLVILDACRDNPFAAQMQRAGQGRSISRGLARIEPDGDTLVVYSAKAGAVAADGDGATSPFATALSRRIDQPGLEISLLFRRVRDDVLKATGNAQEPFTYGSLSGDEFYFVPNGTGQTVTTAAPVPIEPAPAQVAANIPDRTTPATSGDPAEDAYMAGYTAWTNRNYRETENQLQNFAQLYPGHHRASYAQNLLGRAYLDDGQLPNAAAAFLKNYQTDPKGDRAPDSLYWLGTVLNRLGRPKEACKAYNEFRAAYGTNRNPALLSKVAEGRSDAHCGG